MSKWLSIVEIVESVSITHKFDKPKLKFLNTADVEKGKIVNYTELPISELKGQAKKTIQKDDILFSEVRPKNKHYAYVDIEDCSDYVVSTKLMVLRKFNKDVDNKYFYYSLINDKMLDILQSRAENRICSFPQITFDLLSEYKIRIPEISEQKNIAHILEIIDKKIELNNKINSELENFAKTLYDYWFVQFDFPDENERPYKSSGGRMIYNEKLKRNIPYEWSVDNVKSCITHINTGLNPRDNFVLNNGNIKYITVKNLTTQGSIDFSNCDSIDEVAQKIVHKRSDISKGDILFASIAPLGRCYLIQEEPQTWDINESVFSIRPKNTMPSEYLYMFLMSETFVKKAENSSTGSVFAGIRIKTLEDMLIVIPDEKILKQFKEKISKILLQKYNNECENQKLTSIRDFILPMLMNGQVTIQQ